MHVFVHEPASGSSLGCDVIVCAHEMDAFQAVHHGGAKKCKEEGNDDGVPAGGSVLEPAWRGFEVDPVAPPANATDCADGCVGSGMERRKPITLACSPRCARVHTSLEPRLGHDLLTWPSHDATIHRKPPIITLSTYLGCQTKLLLPAGNTPSTGIIRYTPKCARTSKIPHLGTSPPGYPPIPQPGSFARILVALGSRPAPREGT